MRVVVFKGVEMTSDRSIGQVHDISYLIVALSTFDSLQDVKSNSALLQEAKAAINEWVANKALRYGLPRPRPIGDSYCRDIITELRTLGLLSLERKNYQLTGEGYEMLALARSGKTESLRHRLTVLMLTAYHQLSDILQKIYLASPSGEVLTPNLSNSLIRAYIGKGPELASICAEVVRHVATHIAEDLTTMTSRLDELLSPSAPVSEKLVHSAQTAVDKYILSTVFGGLTHSRRSLDVIVSRCTSLELVNTASMTVNVVPCRLIYLTACILPPMSQPSYITGGDEVFLPSGVRVLINRIALNDHGLNTFAMLMKDAYLRRRLDFGQARIADVRADVCHQLRISDPQFNGLIMELRRREPDKISLNYSFEKITMKSRSIIIDEEKAAVYNLMRINY